jgi:hypothetical protein
LLDIHATQSPKAMILDIDDSADTVHGDHSGKWNVLRKSF